MAIFPGSAINAAADYEIEQSLRFNDGDSPSLSFTPSTTGSRTTFTYSCWTKLGQGDHTVLLGAGDYDPGTTFRFFISSSGRIYLDDYDTPNSTYLIRWNMNPSDGAPVLRDPSAWYHIVLSVDTTPAEPAINIYVNGADFGQYWSKINSPSSGTNFNINIADQKQYVGYYSSGTSKSADGYLADVHFIDGQALDPTDFGEADSTYGHWKPIEYSGTYGTNGFFLPFQQDYTVEGFSTTLYTGDGSTSQYIGGVGFRPDLLWIKSRSSAFWHSLCDTVRGPNAVMYSNSTSAEKTDGYNGYINSFETDGFTVGVSSSNGTNGSGSTFVSWAWDMGGDSFGVPLTPNAVTNVEHDTAQSKIGGSSILFNGSSSELSFPDDHKWWFQKHNFTIEFWVRFNSTSGVQDFVGQQADSANRWHLTWHGTNGRLQLNNDQGVNYIDYYRTWTPSADTWYHIAVCRIGSQGNIGDVVWFIDGVKYPSSSIATGGTPPTSFYSSTENLKIGASSVYGNRFNGWLDEIRISNGARYNADFTPSTTPFSNDGDTILLVHSDTTDGSTTFTDSSGADVNTDGSITSYVAANPTYGQSMVSYTGASGSNTIGHGLSSTPEMIIVKNRDATGEWVVYHASNTGAPETDYLRLDSNQATTDYGFWNDTAPTSTVFTVGDLQPVNSGHGNDYIAYCFHSVSGYSKFGGFTGNATVTLGFQPAFILVKRTDALENWFMWDALRNDFGSELYPDASSAEYTASRLTTSSTGFSWTAAGGSEEYIYMAFADKREYAYWLDQSGNNNDFISNNLTESDITVDSPTNNFCTANPLDKYAHTLTVTPGEGNLYIDFNSDSGYSFIGSTFAVSSGKWYFEFTMTNNGSPMVGISDPSVATLERYFNGTTNKSFYYNPNGRTYDGSGSYAQETTWTTGDIISCAFDLDNGKIWWAKNNIWENSGNPATGTNASYTTLSGTYVPTLNNGGSAFDGYLNFGQDSSFAGNKTSQGYTDANGYGDFYYEPPTGYLALCTNNLDDPAVIPSEHFNTITWTGNGTTSRSITGVGFQPDFVWAKENAGAHHVLVDAVRGLSSGGRLSSNRTNAEDNLSNATLDSFDSDGFTTGSSTNLFNTDERNFVSWNWKASGSTASNSDGSITSTVSANPEAGFSIVTYTGTGSNATVGHGLSSTPEIIIYKNRDSDLAWFVQMDGSIIDPLLGGTEAYKFRLLLNSTGTLTFDTGHFSANPTSSTFAVGTSGYTNASSANHLAYCFHSVDGYSKVGTYEGNGSTDGTFVYTGFKPAHILCKNVDDAGSWIIYDSTTEPFNPHDTEQSADNDYAVSSGADVDILSNGFKFRGVDGNHTNTSGDTFIYLAFADTPFKYSNAVGSSFDKYSDPSTGYTIGQSLRFNSGDSSYLTRTPTNASEDLTWTWSAWVKKGQVDGSSNQTIWSVITTSAGSTTTVYFGLEHTSRGSAFTINDWNDWELKTDALLRDPSAWYHIVVAWDVTQGTESERVKVYINGEEASLTENTAAGGFGWDGYPPQDHASWVNQTYPHYIGALSTTYSQYMDGYIADMYMIDGQALTAHNFGYRDSTYGDWRPTAYRDSNPTPDYGPNGYHLDFQSGAIGTDRSGNGNDWTANNLANSDVVKDSPTNNFCTWNPLSGQGTLTEGNLRLVGADNIIRRGTMAFPKTGKWYWEFCSIGASDNFGAYGGVTSNTDENETGSTLYNTGDGGDTSMFSPTYYDDYTSTAPVVTHASSYSDWSSGDICACAIDMDAGEIKWYLNNTLTRTDTTVDTTVDLFPLGWFTVGISPPDVADNIANFGQDSSFAGTKTRQNNTDSNGIGDFYYTPPTGYLALCTSNMDNPTVVPDQNFNTVTYTGTGATNSITGVGFQPDFLWTKNRESAVDNVLFNAITGVYQNLRSNLTGQESTNSNYLLSYDSDGFTVSTSSRVNGSGNEMVAWNWKANGTGSSNSDGDVTSTVSANQDAGFSIVTWTMPSSGSTTVGHGLSSTPELIIQKRRDGTSNWSVYTSTTGKDNKLLLHSTAASASSGDWDNTAPTSSVFTSWLVEGTSDMIAYCFHSVEGYSKIGSYTGNGSTDGAFVYTGFRPAYVLLKATTVVESWWIWDTARNTYTPLNNRLAPDSSNAEVTNVASTADNIDILSNGYKIRGSGGGVNDSGQTYIYMAFAEYPFKHGRAR